MNWEAYIYQHQQGLLDLSEWNAIDSAIENALRRELVRKVWRQRRHIYSSALQQEVDQHFEGKESKNDTR